MLAMVVQVSTYLCVVKHSWSFVWIGDPILQQRDQFDEPKVGLVGTVTAPGEIQSVRNDCIVGRTSNCMSQDVPPYLLSPFKRVLFLVVIVAVVAVGIRVICEETTIILAYNLSDRSA